MALPQLQTQQWDVPFQVLTSICPQRLVPSFNLNSYDRLPLHVTKPYLHVN